MISVELFKFDHKTDYLPYYKTYKLQDKNIATIKDVLDAVNAQEKFSYLTDDAFYLQVNGIFVDANAEISKLLNENNELIIEPLSKKRALNDLVIDTTDYEDKLQLLASYINVDEAIANSTYMLEYYASNTLHFKDDYIGEHVIQLGLDLIENNPDLQDEIMTIIDTEDGLKNRTSLTYRTLATTQSSNTTVNIPTVAQSFENFNIALYSATNEATFQDVIKASNATYIDLKSKHFDIPKHNSRLSNIIAGTVLLEAMDSNADFLIVNDNNDLALFDAKQKSIESTMGREIGLPVVTQNEFKELLAGNKSLSQHKVALSFLN